MEWRVLVLLLLCSQPLVSHCGMHSDVARMKAVVVDVVSSLDVLLATSCRSLTTCAATCLRDHRSVAFTVTRDTVSRGQRLCRCHSASIQEGLTDSIPGPHARLYEFVQRVEPGDGDSQASQTGQGDTSTQRSQTGQSVESTENNHAGQSDITTQSSQVRISDEITPSNEDRKVDESTQGGQRSPAYAAPTTINTLTSLTPSTTQTASTSPTTASVSSSTSITSLTATASSPTGEWLYKTCTNDSWCHGQYDLNTLCVNNFCVCKPGFYYSTGGNTCVSSKYNPF
ncbi:hypothetical protein C0Q70_11401 [Pomacea canaliculata]|uniref:EGF-like domain-containing protein n=1 Tax=Pomacea canaliculata TaxID=400727 RepID=A0A2T7P5X7_POMCA|nr:hypothetical protein C0Q70_11401 [Pomacea canaliculata]